jgi:hypothetical protein
MQKLIISFALVVSLFASVIHSAHAEPIALIKATGKAYTHQKMEGQQSYQWGRSTVWYTFSDAAKNKAYLIGAGHAFRSPATKSIWVRFFYPTKGDTIAAKLEGLRFTGADNNDMALLSIPLDKLPVGMEPLKLEPVEPKIDLGAMTYGCQNGEWPSMMFGYVKEVNPTGFTLNFHVQPGRSGSVVTDEKGKILGMVLRRRTIDKAGDCTSARQITEWLKTVKLE